MKYHFEIVAEASNSPLEVKIQNIDTGEMLTINSGKTNDIEMPYETKTTTNYKLTLTWDKSKTDISYAGQSFKYIIKLVATQKRVKVE